MTAPDNPYRQSFEDSFRVLRAADALSLIDPYGMMQEAEPLAADFQRVAGHMIMDKLEALGLDLDQMEALDLAQLRELAPEEMGIIATKVHSLGIFGKNAVENQLYRTERMFGQTQND